MKKIKKYLLIFVLLLISYGIIAEIAGDPIRWLGSSYMRSDEDSNRIRFNKRIAMEYNAQPFDMSSDFSWSTSTGLNFASNKDSMSFGKMTLNKDSISGETTWNKNYTFKRKHYNIYDSTILSVIYKNTRWNTTAEWFLINTYDEAVNSTEIFDLSSSVTAIKGFVLPHDGHWRVDAYFQIEFALDSVINWGTQDSANVYLDYQEPASQGCWVYKIYNPYNTKSGMKISGHSSIIVPRGITGGNLYAVATENAQNISGSRKVYISNIIIYFTLIQ